MFKPLEGVNVVDLTLAGSGPSCTKLMTEFGANDIWVEALNGTSTRNVHKYDFYCTGKRAIALNLKTPEGKEALTRILEKADVFVSNYRPKGLKNLGLTYEEVKAVKPDIIYATLTGFGEEGAEANDAGYDPVAFWAKGGLLQDFAEKGSLLVPPIAVGDITTGLALFGGICAALYKRRLTGEGCHVFSSLLGSAAYLNHDALIEVQYGEEYPKTRLKPRRAMLNTYQCSDGRWITMTITDKFEKYFHPLLKAIGREDLIGDPRWQCIEDTMYEHAPELVAIFDEAFANMTQKEALEALHSIDAPVAPVQTTEELISDAQVLANKYVYKLEASVPPEGAGSPDIWVPASPIKYNSVDSGVTGQTRGPRIGEHSVDILKEYGYDDAKIRDMLDRGIARQA
ncbi:MAG: CoA transferase [Lachnospiraceae bacterium]|jgi:crotonobetainyl-CoA:carnitine CoA-transferase CaiB-like acyl-CoA transferase|nr:CoA transferase [Lachnospiraceae bacterium]